METKTEQMILYGASGHAKVILNICKLLGVKVEAIVDDNSEIKELNGYRVSSPDQQKFNSSPYIISIGNNAIRKKIVKRNSFQYGTAVHPVAILDETAVVEEGSVLMGGVVVNASVKIGKHNIVNTGATVDHDCILEDYVHVSPNATLCGGIKVGEGTQIGAGAVVLPNLSIGRWCNIGAGAVVIENVPDGATVVGNPGRIVKQNNLSKNE